MMVWWWFHTTIFPFSFAIQLKRAAGYAFEEHGSWCVCKLFFSTTVLLVTRLLLIFFVLISSLIDFIFYRSLTSMIALVRSQFSGVRDQLIWLLNGPEQVPGSDNDNELLHTLDTLITIDHILNIIFCITLLLAFIHFEVQHRLNMDQEDMLIGADEDVVMDSDVEMGDTEDGLQHQMDKSLDKGLPLPSSAGDVQYVDM